MNSQLYIIQAYVFFVIFFIGIIGNAIVIFVLLRQRGSWSITATFLFHLAIADFIFLCFIPFWGHYHINHLIWTFGDGMCKVVGAMTFINMYASIFFLTAMSLDRWFAVVHAAKVRQFRNRSKARCICFGVWTAAFLMSLPSFIFRTLRPVKHASAVNDSNPHFSNITEYMSNNTKAYLFTTESVTTSFIESTDVLEDPQGYQCSFFIPKDGPNNASRKFLAMGFIQVIRSIIGFVIPMTVISICYIRIVITVRVKVISKRVKKDRVAKLAALVIFVFFICWLPYHVMNLYSGLCGWWNRCPFDEEVFSRAYPFTICLAYGNSCINPIIYAFTTTNFQENMKDICVPDNSPRPYQMTLTHPKSMKSPKTQVVALHTRAASDEISSSPGYTRAVKVRLEKKDGEKLQDDDKHHKDRPQELSNAEGQTFSYYSCPAVMEGIHEIDECYESQDCPGGICSAPEDGEIICLTTDKPKSEKV